MTNPSPTPLPVVLPERCCQPGNCAYTPSRVRAILAHIRASLAAGDDPGESAASAFGSSGDGRSPGPSAGADAMRMAQRVWDVQQTIRQIGGRPSAEAISDKLCPFGAEEEA